MVSDVPGGEAVTGHGLDQANVTGAELVHCAIAKPNLQFQTQLLDRAAQLFGAGTGQAEKPVAMKVLHAKIGELALENDFLEAALTKAGLPGARR